MTAKENLEEKISPETQAESTDGIYFTREEWIHLDEEINKQRAEGVKNIDLEKAVRNARYLATLDEKQTD